MVFFGDTNGEILFAEGGRTGNVKMAIDFAAGGVSIGNNVHSKTPPTSGLMVEGDDWEEQMIDRLVDMFRNMGMSLNKDQIKGLMKQF